jgi:hypothetical protein
MKDPWLRMTRALAGALAYAASGGDAGATPVSPPEGECAPDPGERLHDGFFARSESGVALLSASVTDSGAPSRSRVRGVGQLASISIGTTPLAGLVLGGTLWTARFDPVFVEDGRQITPDDDSVKVTLLRLGPFVDWYPNPGQGFHALSTVALALQVETDTKGEPLPPAAFGASLSTGAGYEWFLSSEVSLGFLGRVAFGGLTRAATGGTERSLFVIPEISIAATYH